MLNGIDVSSYQSSMSFNNYDFVIIKASEGVNWKDPGFDRHIKNVDSEKKLYGLYHYARPDLGNTPENEADSFLKIVGNRIGKCILALDWEQKSLNYSPEWALKWLNRVYEKTGVKALFYTQANQAILSKYKIISDADYGLWVAHWGADSPSFENWNFWAIWQYQGSPLDKDYFNGDKTAWENYCKGKEVIEMTEEKVREIVNEEINNYFENKANEECSDWAKEAVEWAMNNSVMVGDKEGDINAFRPKSNITREEVAQALYNCFKKFDN